MNKTLRITLIVVSVLIGAAALVWTGFAFGRSVAWGADGFYPGGMMGSFDRDAQYGYGTMMGSGYNRMDSSGCGAGETMGGSYGMMSNFGGFGMMGPGMMMGGSGYGPGSMMGNFGNNVATEISAELSITPEKASAMAQSYLDQYYPGVEVSEEITAFYGYYTLDTQQNGAIVGMLSVNGFTGQVFPHTWHGDFIEMSEE